MVTKLKCKPIIIVGAARSGTNMLRDILTTFDDVSTWPCDEIPFIWRFGNSFATHDEFDPSMAHRRTRAYIRHAFNKMAREHRVQNLVEKTCANSLRVGFIDAIVPEAKYLWLIRDGRDAVASAMKRWVAPLDLPYVLKKARFVPWFDAPYYGVRFALNRLNRLRASDKRVQLWGPRFEGIEQMAASEPMHVLAAHQWLRCMENSSRDFGAMVSSKHLMIKYEDIIAQPREQLEQIISFCELEVGREQLEQAIGTIKPTSVGKGLKNLPPEQAEEITKIAEETLGQYGYI